MGLLDTVKGWLNIGGVKVEVQDVNPMVPRNGNEIHGKAVLTSKSDKEVQKLVYKFLLRKTSGRGNERKTKDFILGQSSSNEPLTIKGGETRTIDFTIPYSVEKGLKDMGGVLGTVGKLAAFAASEKLEYLVIVECHVKGTALNPWNKVNVEIVD
jgi:hypothetical protein